MNTKEKWIDEFMEKLWEHHTCDWEAENKKPDYPLQLAFAYFNWEYDLFTGEVICPEYTVEEAFNRYLESLDD